MKSLPTVAILAIVLWLSIIIAPSIRAQGGAPDSRQSGNTLNETTLQEVLAGLGYEPKKLTKGVLITVKKDTWTFYVQFVLSGDSTRLGMNANLGIVDKPEEIKASEWMNLLVQNNEIDPSSFNYDKVQKKLYMHRVLDNRAITAAYIRQQIDNFCGNIKETADYWKFVK